MDTPATSLGNHMNAKQAKELLPVIEALASGKTIQFKLDSQSVWHDANKESNINLDATSSEWRVKPEPRRFLG